MASKGASAVLGPQVTMSHGTSVHSFRALPFISLGPSQRPTWEQQPAPLTTLAFPPSGPLVLSAIPGPPLVAGNAGLGPHGTGACNVVVQLTSEGRPVAAPPTQTLVPAPAIIGGTAAGTLCGPAPLFLTASTVGTIMPTPAVGGPPAGTPGWPPGLPTQAPPAATGPAPIMPPGNAGQRPRGASGEGGPAGSQRKTSDNTRSPKSVYQNFRRWQSFKALARSHLPQSPDAEALSCFLIPVLRSLSRRKPTMSLEEGLRRAVQEWQGTSNLDRMIYYEMAHKFMEFEAEEEMQLQMHLQWMQGAQGPPPSAVLQPVLQGPPAPQVAQQPAAASASTSRKAGPRAPCARTHAKRPLKVLKSKAPEEIPPEAVQEYMDIMEWLADTLQPAPGEPGGDRGEESQAPPQEDDDTYPDRDLRSYIDQLCSQEDFVAQVEAIIHPRFLADLLSPEPELDLLALAEVLEQEEELTLAQRVEKQLLVSEDERGVQDVQSLGETPMDTSPTECDARQEAQRHDWASQPGVRGAACPPQADFKDSQSCGGADTGLCSPPAFAISPGRREPVPSWADGHPSPRRGRPASPSLGCGDTSVLGGTRAVRRQRQPADGSIDNEEDLPSLAFFTDLQYSLPPVGLCLSPDSASGLPRPGGQGPPPHRRGRSPAAPPAVNCRQGGPAPAEKAPLLGADARVPGGPASNLGLRGPSVPQKRRADPCATGRRKKRHCSQ